MSDVWARIIGSIIDRWEGGYVDDPDDAGGATKFGITLRNAQRTGLAGTKQELRLVTRDQAIQWYYDEWVRDPACMYELLDLPEELLTALLDAAILFGKDRANTWLQRGINARRLGAKLDQDGIIGPRTRLEAQMCDPYFLTVWLTMERVNHHIERVLRAPSQSKFLRGWFRRAASYVGYRP